MLGSWKEWKGAANEERGCDQGGGQTEKIKTATKTGGIFEDKFAGIVRVVEILVDRRGRWRLLAETADKTGSGCKEKRNKCCQPVSMPHPGFQGQRGEQQRIVPDRVILLYVAYQCKSTAYMS